MRAATQVHDQLAAEAKAKRQHPRPYAINAQPAQREFTGGADPLTYDITVAQETRRKRHAQECFDFVNDHQQKCLEAKSDRQRFVLLAKLN